jgi:DNA-binding LytR/AlgR family response regulator
MEELKISRHQIAAKTYRGVELVPVENIYYFLADQKYVTVRHKNGSVGVDFPSVNSVEMVNEIIKERLKFAKDKAKVYFLSSIF